MKKLGLVIMLIVAASGCAAPQGEHSAEIETLSDDWLAAFEAGDMDGLLSLYSEDARVLPPNAQMMQGHEAVSAVFGGMIAAGLSGAFERVETVSVGDVGYNVGKYTLTAADGAEADRGKFMEVWRKVGGEWKMTYDMFSSDLPAGPAGQLAVFTHEVEDAAIWLAAWQGEDSRHAMFAANGVPSVRVLQSRDNPNLTGLLLDITDAQALHDLLNSPEGAAAKAEDGVKDETFMALMEVQ